MYRSFAITVRPRDGVSDNTISALLKWFQKLDYAFVCLEKEGHERHLHAQIWSDTPKARGDIVKQVERICERTIDDWDQAQKRVLRGNAGEKKGGIKISYSDWYLDYLKDNELKEMVCNTIYEKLPVNTYPFYPTEEEQEKVMTTARAVDQRFTDLEFKCQDFLKIHDKPLTQKSIALFLCDAMFSSRTIKVMMHQRDRTALASALFAFMSKSSNVDLFINKTQEEKKLQSKFDALQLKLQNYTFDTDDSEDE